jgi:ribosomal protein S4
MHINKPRYRIPFQAQSKVWSYKDSRLRRFFNIRGRKLVRRGNFKRYVLVFNNMKWAIARRYIRPYKPRRKAVRRRFRFRNAFYLKQQMKAFHGILRENLFRNIFKSVLYTGLKRKRSFYTSLECRLDIFFFRMRILPTIFAANQYILRYGLLLNKVKQNTPSVFLKPGDLVKIKKEHWSVFSEYLNERLMFRLYGKRRLLRRRYRRLKKKAKWLRKKLKIKKWIFWVNRKYLFFIILLMKYLKYYQNYIWALFRLIEVVLVRKRAKKFRSSLLAPVLQIYKDFIFFIKKQKKKRKFLRILIRKFRLSRIRGIQKQWKKFCITRLKKNKKHW